MRHRKAFDRVFTVKNCLAAVGAAAFAGMLFLLLRGLDRGFDFTDESWYLLSSKYAALYPFRMSHYVVFDHAILAANGWSIPGLRAAGLLLLLICGGVFARSFLPCLKSEKFSWAVQSLIVLGLLAGSLWVYQWWILTPAYNEFIIIGFLLYGAGLCRFYARQDNFARLLCLGLGIGISILSKPPGGLILIGLLPAVFILEGWQWRVWLKNSAVILAIAALGAVAALAPDMEGAWQKFIAAAQAYRVSHDDYKLLGQLEHLGRFIKFLLPYAIAVPILVLIGKFMQRRGIDVLRHAPLWLGALFIFVMARPMENGPILFLMLCGFALPCGLIAGESERRRWWLIAVLLALPLIGALGTDNEFRGHYPLGAVFVFAAMLLALPQKRGWLPALLAAGLIIISFKMLYLANMMPYRLMAPIAQQDQKIDLPGWGQGLKTDRVTAQYVAQLQKEARDAGWQPGTALIDLTGNTPGAALALDAYPPGFGWLLGGFSGARPFAALVLKSAPPKILQSAWVLTEPDSKIAIPAGVMQDMKLDFPGAYEAVATLHYPLRDDKQILYRPRD